VKRGTRMGRLAGYVSESSVDVARDVVRIPPLWRREWKACDRG
jgi:hypothetical protein